MFCPECHSEYRSGFTTCADCGVDLVAELSPQSGPDDALNRAIDQSKNPDVYQIVGEHGDLATILAILDAAGIPHSEAERHITLPGLGSRQTVILVKPQYRALADKAFDDYEKSVAIPIDESEYDRDNSDDPPANDFVPDDFNPDDATVEVWHGDDLDLHNTLVECLTNVGIGCATHLEDTSNSSAPPAPSAKPNLIFVLPSDEKRAREVIREIDNASPPE
jgi:hypothetical protein